MNNGNYLPNGNNGNKYNGRNNANNRNVRNNRNRNNDPDDMMEGSSGMPYENWFAGTEYDVPDRAIVDRVRDCYDLPRHTRLSPISEQRHKWWDNDRERSEPRYSPPCMPRAESLTPPFQRDFRREQSNTPPMADYSWERPEVEERPRRTRRTYQSPDSVPGPSNANQNFPRRKIFNRIRRDSSRSPADRPPFGSSSPKPSRRAPPPQNAKPAARPSRKRAISSSDRDVFGYAPDKRYLRDNNNNTPLGPHEPIPINREPEQEYNYEDDYDPNYASDHYSDDYTDDEDEE